MEKNRSKTDKRLKNLKTDAGPGRPKGQRNYATLYRLAMEKIAVAEGMSIDDFEIKFVQQAIRKGFNGDTRLYTDTLDRIHGKAQQALDITSGGKVLVSGFNFVKNDTDNQAD